MRHLSSPIRRPCVGLLAFTSLLCVGCDSGGTPSKSGVDRAKYLDQLTASERRTLCTWAITAQGGPHDYVCGDSGTGNVYSVEECVASPPTSNTHCRVALVEDCIDSLHGDTCQLFVTPECKAYVTCLMAKRDAS
jgi:hypothetical protein